MKVAEETETTKQLKPPYGNVTWYRKFFELLRTRSFDKFDKEIIELNIVKRANATMLFNGLRFLGLVEDDGKVTGKFESLRRKGDEFQQNLEQVVKEAYSHLFSKVVVSKAKPQTLFNYFAEYYKYGEKTATLSSKIFTYLCQEAGIELSPELAKEKFIFKIKPRKKRKPSEPTGDEAAQEQLSEDVLARFTLKGTGYVDIKDKDTFEIAKAYLKVLSKKLRIDEGEEN